MARQFTEQLALVADSDHGVSLLRDVVLDLAIRGLLVSHKSNSSAVTARAGTLNAWPEIRLGDLALVERGGSPRPIKDFITDAPDGLNWIKIGDTDRGGKYITSAAEKIRPEGLSKTRRVYPGDFLLTNSMSFGRPYITQIEGCIHDGWLRISPSATLDRDYLYILLSSPYARRFFASAAAGAVVMNLNAEKVRDLPILLPPLSEQRCIVAKVDELMVLCDRLEARQQSAEIAHARLVQVLLNGLAQAGEVQACWQQVMAQFATAFATEASVDALRVCVLQLGVMGRLGTNCATDEPADRLLSRIGGSPCDDESGPLPANWCWTKFSAICSIRSALVRPEDNLDAPQVAPDCIEKGTGRLLLRRTVRESGVRGPNSRFNTGQIVYSKIRPSLSKVVVAEFSGLCSADMYPIDSKIDVQYQLYLMLSEPFLAQVRAAENRVKMPKLNQESLNEFLVPLPPLPEQQRIAAKITDLLYLCDQLKARIAAARAKQAQLAKVLVESAVN